MKLEHVNLTNFMTGVLAFVAFPIWAVVLVLLVTAFALCWFGKSVRDLYELDK